MLNCCLRDRPIGSVEWGDAPRSRPSPFTAFPRHVYEQRGGLRLAGNRGIGQRKSGTHERLIKDREGALTRWALCQLSHHGGNGLGIFNITPNPLSAQLFCVSEMSERAKSPKQTTSHQDESRHSLADQVLLPPERLRGFISLIAEQIAREIEESIDTGEGIIAGSAAAQATEK
jgi:hypothetical protein